MSGRRLTAAALLIAVITAVLVSADRVEAQSAEPGGGGRRATDREASAWRLPGGAATQVFDRESVQPVVTDGAPGGELVGPGPSEGAGGGSGSGGGPVCSFERLADLDQLAPEGAQAYWRTCPTDSINPGITANPSPTGIDPGGLVFVRDSPGPGGPPDPAPVLVDPFVVAMQARRQLRFPEPVPASAPGLESGTYARLPTHFWVANWEPAGPVEASVGAVSASVTATPLRQEWVIRDGFRGATVTVTCRGPGSRVEPGVTPDPVPGGAPPACGWRPDHSSAGQSATSGEAGRPCFPATVSVTWQVTWTSNLPGEGGTLPSGSSSTDVCLVVSEVQALVTERS